MLLFLLVWNVSIGYHVADPMLRSWDTGFTTRLITLDGLYCANKHGIYWISIHWLYMLNMLIQIVLRVVYFRFIWPSGNFTELRIVYHGSFSVWYVFVGLFMFRSWFRMRHIFVTTWHNWVWVEANIVITDFFLKNLFSFCLELSVTLARKTVSVIACLIGLVF